VSVLFVITVAIAACGVVLLLWMYRRDDSRLGMAGLGVLIVANIFAMVHAALNSV
jgi:hypothetical protein